VIDRHVALAEAEEVLVRREHERLPEAVERA
jgi:hypothetical protein